VKRIGKIWAFLGLGRRPQLVWKDHAALYLLASTEGAMIPEWRHTCPGAGAPGAILHAVVGPAKITINIPCEVIAGVTMMMKTAKQRSHARLAGNRAHQGRGRSNGMIKRLQRRTAWAPRKGK